MSYLHGTSFSTVKLRQSVLLPVGSGAVSALCVGRTPHGDAGRRGPVPVFGQGLLYDGHRDARGWRSAGALIEVSPHLW